MNGIYKQHSAEHFLFLWDHGSVGVVILNLDGQILEANQTFANYLGYSTSELESKTVTEITAHEDRVAGMREMEKVAQGKIPYMEMDKSYISKRGQTLPAHLTSGAIFNSDGTVSHMVSEVIFYPGDGNHNAAEYMGRVGVLEARLQSLQDLLGAIVGKETEINVGTQTRITGNSNTNTTAEGGVQQVPKWLVVCGVSLLMTFAFMASYIVYSFVSPDPEPPQMPILNQIEQSDE